MTTVKAYRERLAFEEALVNHGVMYASTAADSLRRLARAISRHNERECSDEHYCNTRYGTSKAERVEAQLERRVARLAQLYGLKLETQGDPRGYALRVMGLGVWNTWGGEESGYGVPEA